MSDASNTTPSNELQGLSVLVVEDNGLLSCILEETLRDAGCRVVGPFSRLREAMTALPTAEIDLALLDINLKGELVSPLAEQLQQRGVPFLLTSAYQTRDLPRSLQSASQLRKPYTDTDLLERLSLLASARNQGD